MTLVKLTKEEIKSVIPITSDKDIVRSALMAELDAISLYETQIENLHNKHAERLIRHIMLEEKEHAAELWCLLMLLDPDQEDKMTEVPLDTCTAY
jgi:rubrerythrin